MLFTRLGYVLAFFALILGAFHVYTGILDRQHGLETWSGKEFELGVYLVILGIALGILAEIRYALRRKITKTSD